MIKVKLGLLAGAWSVLFFITACSHNTGQATHETAVNTTEAAKYQTYVKAGQRVPVMQFIDIQGQHINLGQSEHKKLLILFATWCPDSQRAMKALVQSTLMNDDTVDIIGIGREESVASLQRFAKEYHVPFSLVADKDRSVYRQFASAGIPRFILLDKHNQIVKTILLEDDEGNTGQLLAPIQW